jgi:hypothetical protein
VRFLISAITVLGLLAPSPARAEERDEGVTEPHVRPTLIWFATQLVPSPEIASGESGTYFGLRWQVTPLLWSWGINRKLSPWRVLIAEPLVRYSGSVELFLSPELVFAGGDFGDKWLVRPGTRAYFPIVQHGDNLAASIGTSFQHFQGKSSAAFEAGAYVLYGVFGVQLTYTPAPHQPLATIATLRFRYF